MNVFDCYSRKLCFLLLISNLFLWSSSNFAQSLEQLANATPTYTEEYDLKSLLPHQIYIATPFAKPLILNPEQEKQLKEKVVLNIELVYTKFRTSPTFNQIKLNHNRLKELKKVAPILFENPLWEYKLISQTNGNSREYCNNMFHGFVITFRPNSNNTNLKKEASYLDDLVTTMLKNDSIKNDTTPKGFSIKTHYDLNKGYIHDTTWHFVTISPPRPPDFFYNHGLYKDSTVLNVFDRNKHWKNFVVVTDVTGSMSPYSAQVFVWLKAQTENAKAKYFVFFNDGDDKDSQKKKPLDTKGIYVTENKSVDDVTKTALKCMERGDGGGENMENDVEAIIEGIKYYPNADAVILVADNMESMRDYKYLDKIKKPVIVILCGTRGRINVQYLDLARQTKGSIHTATSDMTNLQNIKAGENFFIDEKEYTYQNGRFHSVYEQFKYQNKSVR